MPFWRRSNTEPAESDAERISRIVAEHLPPEMASTYLGLARPALHLGPAIGGRPAVGQLGGAPELPAESQWPTWAGHGPLTFIAALDCAALRSYDTGGLLPLDGQLL